MEVTPTNAGRPTAAANHLGLVRQVARRFKWATGTVMDEGDLLQALSTPKKRAKSRPKQRGL